MYQYILFACLLSLGRSGVIDIGSQGGGWQQNGGLDDGNGHGSPDGSIGGDFHHGISLVSTGGGGKGAIFDLTNHGTDRHQGTFGGSFVASSKYSVVGHEGGGSGGHGGGYGVSEGAGWAADYSPVLGASESIGGGGDAVHEGLSAYQGSIEEAYH